MRRTGQGGLDDLFDTLKSFSRKKDPHAGMDTGNIDGQGGNSGGSGGGKKPKLPGFKVPGVLLLLILAAVYLSQGAWYSLDEDNRISLFTCGSGI